MSAANMRMDRKPDNGPDHVGAIERHLGLRLKQLRLKFRLSRARVDEVSRQPAGTCRLLEGGESFFGPTELYALARTFDIDPSYFFDGLPLRDTPAKSYPVLVGDPERARETEFLIEAFRDIDDSGLRHSILELINAVAEDPSRVDQLMPPT